MSDIVADIRRMTGKRMPLSYAGSDYAIMVSLCRQAADEIERLRIVQSRRRKRRLTKSESLLLDAAIDAMDPEFGPAAVPPHQVATASAIHALLVRVRKCL